MRRNWVYFLVSVFLAAPSIARAQQQELPRFRSSVELTSIDASVFDDRGKPIVDLTPEDFTVRVDGTNRRVVSAEWVPLSTAPGTPPPPVPAGYSSNDNATGGRLIVIVVDQPNIRFGGTAGIRKAMYAFIDRLEPSDRVAVLGIGPNSASTNFTADRERMKRTIDKMSGLHRETGFFSRSMSLTEALDIRRSVPSALAQVVSRECRDSAGRMLQGPELDICVIDIEHQALEVALDATTDGTDTVSSLRNLLIALRGIDAPKTLILVTEGFVIDDQSAAVYELGALSAAARTSIYGLKLDDSLLMMAASEARAPIAPMDDRMARSNGLEILAGASRGSLFNVIGTGMGIFERISSEMSGYYLLGVESGPSDKDGKSHPVRVDVSRRGATVRARRALLALPEVRAPRTPRESMVAALSNPLPASGLPLRVATYSLQGPEAQKVQVLIHADVGRDYATSRVVSLGYVITDEEGRMVENQAATARLPPVMSGVPSALQFSGGASLAPGTYLMKLAVAEGERVGTVEHLFRAGVAPAGDLRVSDLMVGGPAFTGEELLQPTVGYNIVFGAVHGYIEAYGPNVSLLTARYEIAPDETADAILETDVMPRLAGSSRAIFTRVMPARQLPPGKYLLRATLLSGTETVKVETRAFEVATPAVLMTSASTSSVGMPFRDLFLPVTEQALTRKFNAAEASESSTVQLFRDKVPAASRETFDKGVRALASGDYVDAELTLKSVITPEEDSSAVIAYLAAVFAAAGRDNDAAGAWQTALIEGTELPQIYEWLTAALMRTRDLALARSMLEEAILKWPSDERFARPMALIFATFGQGDQAVRSLERHLAVHKDDVEALQMAVEWIYQLRVAGASAHSPAEDLKLAKSYAEAYQKAKGPQMALVRQWMAHLEKK